MLANAAPTYTNRLTAVYSDPRARNVHANENRALFLLCQKISMRL